MKVKHEEMSSQEDADNEMGLEGASEQLRQQEAHFKELWEGKYTQEINPE